MSSTPELTPAGALRHALWLALQRAADAVRVVAFAAVVPRVIGPAVYGQYSLVLSMALWFALLSGFGATQVMSFFVPPMLKNAERGAVERLFGGFLVLRIGSGTLAAWSYFVVTALWLRDIDLTVLALAAASVLLRTVANVLFAFRLGLGDSAGWGTGEVARQWIVLALILPGAFAFGLRGAVAAVLVAELVLIVAGAAWSRGHLRLATLRFDRAEMAPYLRFNAWFLAGNVVFAACQRGGEALLRAGGGAYAEIGVFAAAYGVYQFAYQGCRSVSTGMGPYFTALRSEGRLPELAAWAGRLCASLAALGGVAALATAALGPHLVPLVLGPSYAHAVSVLEPLVFALPAVAVAAVARVLAVTFERPSATFAAAVVQAATMAGAGLLLVPRHGAVGAALAILLAALAQAVVLVAALRPRLRLPLGSWAAVVAPALLLAVPFLALRNDFRRDATLFVAALGVYAATARAAGVLTLRGLTAARD